MDYTKARGILTGPERDYLYARAKSVPANGWMVNIGIEYGASLVCLRQGNPTAHLIGIDIIGTERLETPIPHLKALRYDSTKLRRAWVTPDLAFIDGGHDYMTVTVDAHLWGDAVKPGGVVIFHDCLAPHIKDHKGEWCAIIDEVNSAVEAWFHRSMMPFEELPPVDSIRSFRRYA